VPEHGLAALAPLPRPDRTAGRSRKANAATRARAAASSPRHRTDYETAQLNRTVADLRHEVARPRQQLGGERPGYLVRVEDVDLHRTVYRAGRGFAK
jgi:hypothetical protein